MSLEISQTYSHGQILTPKTSKKCVISNTKHSLNFEMQQKYALCFSSPGFTFFRFDATLHLYINK